MPQSIIACQFVPNCTYFAHNWLPALTECECFTDAMCGTYYEAGSAARPPSSSASSEACSLTAALPYCHRHSARLTLCPAQLHHLHPLQGKVRPAQQLFSLLGPWLATWPPAPVYCHPACRRQCSRIGLHAGGHKLVASPVNVRQSCLSSQRVGWQALLLQCQAASSGGSLMMSGEPHREHLQHVCTTSVAQQYKECSCTACGRRQLL
jgi:hypothetical protein